MNAPRPAAAVRRPPPDAGSGRGGGRGGGNHAGACLERLGSDAEGSSRRDEEGNEAIARITAYCTNIETAACGPRTHPCVGVADPQGIGAHTAQWAAGMGELRGWVTSWGWRGLVCSM